MLYRPDLMATHANNLYDAVEKLRPSFLQPRGSGTSLRGEVNGSAPAPGGAPSSAPVATPPTDPNQPANPSTGAQPIIVYVDGARTDGVSALKDIQVTNVASVQYVPGPQAAVRFGMDNIGGALLITSQ